MNWVISLFIVLIGLKRLDKLNKIFNKYTFTIVTIFGAAILDSLTTFILTKRFIFNFGIV